MTHTVYVLVGYPIDSTVTVLGVYPTEAAAQADIVNRCTHHRLDGTRQLLPTLANHFQIFGPYTLTIDTT